MTVYLCEQDPVLYVTGLSIPNINKIVTPPSSADPTQSASRDYGKTQIDYIVKDYIDKRLTSSSNPIDWCKAVKDCENSPSNYLTLKDGIEVTSSNQYLTVNTDPEKDVDLPSVCLMCKSTTGQIISSNTFSVKVSCDSSIQVFEPPSFQQNQVKLTATSNWATFDFSSFQTKTKACPVSLYYVTEYKNQSPLKPSQGLNVLSVYDENAVSGVTSAKSFSLGVFDGMSPYVIRFVLKVYVYVSPGQTENVHWSPLDPSQSLLSLTLNCPTQIPVYSVEAIQNFETYIGAPVADATYVFPQFFPTLPKCSQVIGYQIQDLSSTSSSLVIYPNNACSSDPCNEIGIVTNAVTTFSFKIKINTSVDAGSSALSDLITIKVVSSLSTPFLTAPTLSARTYYVGPTSQAYSFSLFVCSSFCRIDNYKSSSSSGSVIPVSGVDQSATYNYLSKQMELQIDTTQPRTLQFYIYAEKKGTPTIFAYTPNKADIQIICGNEVVSVSVSQQQQLGPFIRESNSETFSGVGLYFQSNIAACSMKEVKLCKDKDCESPLSNSQIKLLSPTSLSQTQLEVDKSSPMKIVFYLVGISQGNKSNFLQYSVTVCGNEVVQAVPKGLDLTKQLMQESENKQIFINDWFSTSFSSETSLDWCNQLSYSLKQAPDCNTPLSLSKPYLSIVSKDTNYYINVDAANALNSTTFCLQATTLGKKTANQTITIESCGFEYIYSEGPTQISKIVKKAFLKADVFSFFIRDEGVQVFQTRPGCPLDIKVKKKDGFYRQKLKDGIEGQGNNLNISSFSVAYNLSIPQTEDYNLIISNDNFQIDIYLPAVVCGFEKMSSTLTISKVKQFGDNSDVYLHSIYKKGLFSNSINCPCEIYSLLFSANGLYYPFSSVSSYILDSEVQKLQNGNSIDWRTQLSKTLQFDQDYNLIFNPTFQQDLRSLMSKDWLEQGEEISLAGGTFKVRNQKIEVKGFIEGRTGGDKTSYIPVTFIVTTPSMKSALNFAPAFVINLDEISMTVTKPEQIAAKNLIQTFLLPNIQDLEGDSISVTDCGNPILSFQFEQQERGLMKGQLKVDKIGVKNTTTINCALKLRDSYGNQREEILVVKILYIDTIQKTSDFSIPYYLDTCQPLVKLLRYSFTCNSQLSAIICDIFYKQVCYIEDYKEQKDIDIDIQTEINKFNQEALTPESLIPVLFVTTRLDQLKVDVANQQLLRKNIIFNFNDMYKGLITTQILYEGIQLYQDDKGDYQGRYCQSQPTSNMAEKIIDTKKLATQIEEIGRIPFINNESVKDFDKKLTTFQTNITLKNTTLRVVEQLILSKISFDQIDLVTFEFSQPLSVPDSPKNLTDILSQWNVFNLSIITKPENIPIPGYYLSPQQFGEIQLVTNETSPKLYFTVYDVVGGKIILQVAIVNQNLISSTPYGRDLLQVEITNQSSIIGAISNNYLVSNNTNKKFELFRQMSKESQKIIGKLIDSCNSVILASTIGALIVMVMTNGPIAKIWSLVKSQQISIHFSLFNVPNIPSHTSTVQKFICRLNQRSMYDPNLIYSKFMFLVTGNSFNELFVLMRYEGSNFLLMAGSLFPNTLMLTILISLSVVLMVIAKFGYKHKGLRKLGANLPLINLRGTLYKMLQQGYLEAVICCLIQVVTDKSVSHKSKVGRNLQSEEITQIDSTRTIAIAYLVVLLVMPIYGIFNIVKHRNDLETQAFKVKYGFLVDGLKCNKLQKALFFQVFLIRRLIYACLLVFLRDTPNLQILLNLSISIIYVSYILHTRPFDERKLLNNEIINEGVILVMGILYTMFIMDDSILSWNSKDIVGWVFISLYGLIIVYNLKEIYKQIILVQLPQSYRNFKHSRLVAKFKEYILMRNTHFGEQVKLHPNDVTHQEALCQTQRIKEFLEAKQVRDKNKMYLGRLKRFLLYNDLPLSDLNNFEELESLKEEQKNDLESQLTLPVENMLQRQYFYSNFKGKSNKIYPPFQEYYFRQVLDQYLKDKNVTSFDSLTKAQQRQAEKAIRVAKEKKLITFLKLMKVKMVTFDSQSADDLDLLIKYLNLTIDTSVQRSQEIRDHLERVDRDQWLEDAAELIDRQIVVLSADNKMAYMDRECRKQDNSMEMPLFLFEDIQKRLTMIIPGNAPNLIKTLTETEGVRLLEVEQWKNELALLTKRGNIQERQELNLEERKDITVGDLEED